MKYPTHALLITALAVGAFASGSTRAASLSTLEHIGAVGYSATTDDALFDSHAGDDLSADGSVALFGAAEFSNPVQGGQLQHSYAADAYFGAAGNGAELFMSLSHSLAVDAAGAYSATHQHDVFADLSSVMLRIDGTDGEALGTAVRVSFAGLASLPLHDVGGDLGASYFFAGLSVTQGDAVLGEFLWDPMAGAEQVAAFSFTGYVGQSYTFSSYMLSGLGGPLAGTGTQTLGEVAGSLGGSFSVTPVPEPETYAMLIAGLAAMGAVVRRRRNGSA